MRIPSHMVCEHLGCGQEKIGERFRFCLKHNPIPDSPVERLRRQKLKELGYYDRPVKEVAKECKQKLKEMGFVIKGNGG